jgi:competence protein ComFA
MFGMIREDTVLWRSERNVKPVEHRLKPGFPLSLAQEEASRFVCRCRSLRQSGFLHAVCGAGKTEILYAALLEGLREGWRIAIAIPRKDIVAELAIRFRTVFPLTVVKALYEGSKDDQGAHLVISTLHQLIRYYQEFDWIVLDEADAFPYRDDPLLHRLLRKSLKPDGALFLMSATLNREMENAIRRGEFRLFTLSARFHGHPLDIPRMIQVPDLNHDLRLGRSLPSPLLSWLCQKNNSGCRVLLFVPSVEYGITLGALLGKSGFPSGVVSSQTPKSARVVERFRAGEWDFLVTTTLLERGVTFSGIDVAVLSADHPVFDADTLIQIAGRVGRDPKRPHGEVVFFSEEKTRAMVGAVRTIRSMNGISRKAGLLVDEM